MKPQGFPKKVRLKDGSIVTLRLQEGNDAGALLAFYRSLPEEDRIFLDDDCTARTWADRFIQRSDFDRIIPIVAGEGEEVFGHAWLIRDHYGWMAHVGELRMAIARAHQRQGLGSAMIRELLRIATDLGLEKMTVRMMDNQYGAIRAFEKIGFRKEAIFHGLVKDVLGRHRNLVIMADDISQIWGQMENLVADTPPREEFGG